MHKKLVALLCFGLMITIAGCGASNPPTTPVTGQVKYDGEALEGATVTLTPEAGSADTRTASGITDADGNFTLTTIFSDGQSCRRYSSWFLFSSHHQVGSSGTT